MPRDSQRLHDIRGDVLLDRPLSFLFLAEDSKKPVFLPKSQCQWDESDQTMTMPEWLAMEKGLI